MAADVRNYGACLDGVSDDTQAFNDALAESDTVIFPKGRARVTDQILIPNNKQLIGEGVKQSVFAIGLDFNKSALGVVKMGTSENMGLIDKIGFEFEQPVSSLRSDMIQYPPAIYHRGIPRVRIGHVRFSRAWDGIDAGLNAGGATYDFIECGTLHKGLLIDGALDTMNIGRFRVWPFGMSQNSDIGLVYRDGETIGAEIGKCDGLEGSIQCFAASVVFNINGGGSAGPSSFRPAS